jgi:hypothetical protein
MLPQLVVGIDLRPHTIPSIASCTVSLTADADRSHRSPIHYAVRPGTRQDDLMKVPHLAVDVAVGELTAW